MKWKQKIKPNVNVPGESGGCLAYVDDGINPPNRQPTAQTSWQLAKNMKVAHPNEEPPLNVWVAVYYEILNGQWAGYGHVAWFYSDGHTTQIYDSEYGCGNRSVPYSSGLDMYNYMGWQMRYLGWSEAVDGKRVVEVVKEVSKKDTDQKIKNGGNKMYVVDTEKNSYLVASDGKYMWLSSKANRNAWAKVCPVVKMSDSDMRAMFGHKLG
ncbi:hypothetical protein ACRPK2_04025 [Lactococcus garvieae]|uniref:hypothetical protein n=1 Tax=Lactococcus garvieae TaxID=1363 RepID=UPI003D778C0E